MLVDSSANGAINVQGMQFAVDGYVLQGIASGDKLSLKGSPAGSGPNEATIRVGDGTAAGAGYTATIATVLDGAVKVVKTDLGTLALSGVNTHTGARRSTAARCRYPRTRTWARLRARCR